MHTKDENSSHRPKVDMHVIADFPLFQNSPAHAVTLVSAAVQRLHKPLQKAHPAILTCPVLVNAPLES